MTKDELDLHYRAMMSEEAKAEEDLVAWIGMISFFVVGFLVLLVLSLGAVFLWMVFI